MSAELKQLVTDALETDGTLGKIKAQLRSTVIKAIDQQDKAAGGHGISRNMAQNSVNATPEGGVFQSPTHPPPNRIAFDSNCCLPCFLPFFLLQIVSWPNSF